MSSSSNTNSLQNMTRQRASSFSDVLTSEHTKTLIYLLNNMDATSFVQRLLSATKPENGHTPEDFESLIKALKGVGFERSLAMAERATADDTPKHCVRCHDRYLERDNRVDACVIQHSYAFTVANDSSTSLKNPSNSGRCLSCNNAVPPSAVVNRQCIVARHTTNPENISGLRNPLIQTCEDLKCHKPQVKEQASGPLANFSFAIAPTNALAEGSHEESPKSEPKAASVPAPTGFSFSFGGSAKLDSSASTSTSSTAAKVEATATESSSSSSTPPAPPTGSKRSVEGDAIFTLGSNDSGFFKSFGVATPSGKKPSKRV